MTLYDQVIQIDVDPNGDIYVMRPGGRVYTVLHADGSVTERFSLPLRTSRTVVAIPHYTDTGPRPVKARNS